MTGPARSPALPDRDALAASSQARPRPAAAAPDGARPRLLVVDDVFDNRDILTRRLTRRGFEVTEAAGGFEALAILAEDAFDLVLLDVMMPDLSGIEVLKRIRAERSPMELPVIMVTAYSGSDDAGESISLGANDYVTKPVDFVVALARINEQLAKRGAAGF